MFDLDNFVIFAPIFNKVICFGAIIGATLGLDIIQGR
jgi:hypothetical protein